MGPSHPLLSITYWLSHPLLGDMVCEALASSADSQGAQLREKKASGSQLVSRSTGRLWEPRVRGGKVRSPGNGTSLAQPHGQGPGVESSVSGWMHL